MKFTENTKCWVCGRTAKELKAKIEEYWQSGDLYKDMDLEAVFEEFGICPVTGGKETIHIPICHICVKILTNVPIRYLRGSLEIKLKMQKPKVLFRIRH